MKFTNIAIIGAGAIGAYVYQGLSTVSGIHVRFIASGSRLERLKSQGLRINEKDYSPEVSTPEEAGFQDLVLLATKYDGLDSAIEECVALVGPDTLVLSLLNGLDSEERLAARIGWEHVEYSLVRVSSERSGREIKVRAAAGHGIYVGQTPHTDALKELFASSGARLFVVDDIKKDLWVKFAANVANNLPQAILNTGACLYTDSEHGRYIAETLWYECAAVAATQGIDLGTTPGIFKGVRPDARYSTLQDLDSRRHTEIDMFCGVLMKLAEKAGVPVPFATYTYHAIKALEEKNDGIIG